MIGAMTRRNVRSGISRTGTSPDNVRVRPGSKAEAVVSRFPIPQGDKSMRFLKLSMSCLGATRRRRSPRPMGYLTHYRGLFVLHLVAGAALADAPITSDAIEWELSLGSVVDSGESIVLPEGTLTQGFTIEAKARADDSKYIPRGTLRLSLTAFTPSIDLPGQSAGYTYVQGKWTVTDQASTGESKHSPGMISGVISAELDFDPTASPAAWSAEATLPMSTITPVGADGIQWARGEGELTLSPGLEGELELAVEVWPVATAAK